MLLEGALDDNGRTHALEVIDRNAHLQARLVGDILDVSRIITGGLKLDIRPVDLVAVIGAALDAVRPAADARGFRSVPSWRSTRGRPKAMPTDCSRSSGTCSPTPSSSPRRVA